MLTVELVSLTGTTTMVTIESGPAAPLQVIDWGTTVRNVRSIPEKMASLHDRLHYEKSHDRHG